MTEAYRRVHRSRANLAIHLLAVPFFWLSVALLVIALFRPAWPGALAGGLVLVLSLAAQGRGHRLEDRAPEPFAGPADAVRRILREQFWTFPRFLLGGGWLRAWRDASRPPAAAAPTVGAGETGRRLAPKRERP